MPYTVHTLDGQAHTYPNTATLYVEDDRSLRVHDNVEMVPGAWPVRLYPDPIVVYPAGQWTHYHIEPVPYETDHSNTDTARDAQDQADATKGMTANAEAWATQFKSHLDAGRKAALAQ